MRVGESILNVSDFLQETDYWSGIGTQNQNQNNKFMFTSEHNLYDDS